MSTDMYAHKEATPRVHNSPRVTLVLCQDLQLATMQTPGTAAASAFHIIIIGWTHGFPVLGCQEEANDTICYALANSALSAPFRCEYSMIKLWPQNTHQTCTCTCVAPPSHCIIWGWASPMGRITLPLTSCPNDLWLPDMMYRGHIILAYDTCDPPHAAVCDRDGKPRRRSVRDNQRNRNIRWPHLMRRRSAGCLLSSVASICGPDQAAGLLEPPSVYSPLTKVGESGSTGLKICPELPCLLPYCSCSLHYPLKYSNTVFVVYRSERLASRKKRGW